MLQQPQPAQAGRGREADRLGQGGIAHPAIGAEQAQQGAVGVVQRRASNFLRILSQIMRQIVRPRQRIRRIGVKFAGLGA